MMKKNPKKGNDELIFFNQALEYFDYPVEDISKEKDKTINTTTLKDSDLLRDEMLSELDHIKELIINHPDAKIAALTESERVTFSNFMRCFSICPICGSQNHYIHLKGFYFSEEKKKIKNSLLSIMKCKHQKFKLNYGILCCNCFKKYFE